MSSARFIRINKPIELNFIEFAEPMMITTVINYEIVNPANIKDWKWFKDEQIAEYHNLRYEDCDKRSTWLEG